MKQSLKRFVSTVLTVLMLISVVQVGNFTSFAADASHNVDAATAASRTNALVNALTGKYFTTTQSSCGNNQCSSCYNANIIGYAWLKNATGLVPDSYTLLPEHYYNSSGVVTSNAWSCAGFANYCLWYIYAKNPSDNVRRTLIYSGGFTKANMDASSVRTGDVIRVGNSHSFVYLSHNSDGVTVLDSNWSSDHHNLVQKHLINWTYRSGQTMAITRGKNWTENSSSTSFISSIVNYASNLINNTPSKTTGYVSHTTSSDGINFIKNFEGLRTTAYKDSAGVWTIGYGHTKGVYSGMQISEAQATQYLKSDLANAESAVNSFLKKNNRYVSQTQFDALVSFTFNVGSGWTTNSSYNIYKYMATGNHTDQQVKDTFGSWCNAGGVKVAGLVTRRAKEAALYLYGTYSGSGGTTSSSSSSSSASSGAVTSVTASYSKGIYKVTASSGLNVRSGPGTGYGIQRSIAKNTQVSIVNISGNWGQISGGGWICLDFAVRVGDLEPVINVPAAPQLNLTSAANIATGKAVTVAWNSAADAVCYDIYLKNSNGSVSQQIIGSTGRTAAFTINSAGTYTITAVSRNTKYTSTTSNTITVRAYAPSTVKFVDWNGTVLSSQSVAYGSSATAPANPSRYGWTFKRWNGTYTNVTSNQTVTAYYERNVYTVTFVDESGDVIGAKQKIEFEGSAKAPNYNAPEGYTFLKWDKDFSYIESNLTVSPVIVWANDDLPVTILSATTAVRESTGYTVNVSVRNNPTKATDGRVIVALKTDSGKLLSMTESAAFHLKTSADKTIEVFMPYDKAATIAEIYVVETFSTAIPISAVLSKKIDQGTAWTNWSTSPNPSDAYQSESRKEYRYRTKSTTTSSSSSLSGWTKYDTTSAWSAYGSWSDWTDTKITASDSRQVETRTVVASTNHKTVYHYYRYATSEHASSGSYAQSSSYPNLYSYAFDSPLESTTALNGHARYKWWYSSSNWHGLYAASPYTTQEVVSYNYKTQYRYRDRSLNYTYYYYKWSDWSAWSTTSASATSTKEVETRTTYRYLANNPSLVADNSGVERTISGKVDASLAGEQAILFVYKINEASDFTNEFVGQSLIGKDGSYSFTFKLREEPSVQSGDYTVTLGIEGTNTAIYLDPIEAPKPQHTVTYLDWDGTVINKQTVIDGENAVLPDVNPSREGYDFICWNNTATNVKDDMTVSPVYKIKEYTVVFVDWTKESVVLEKYEHGQPLVAPEIENTDDSFAVGWDIVIDGTTVVTRDMIITAKYDKKMYNVNFLDEKGNIFDSQVVEYGTFVDTPESLTNKNVNLFGWVSEGEFEYVTEDLTIIPVYNFKNTVATPVANLVSGEYESTQVISLSCETENAVIYYSTDGSNPLENGIEYTNPITIDKTCELTFAACAFEMNDSDTAKSLYAINNGKQKDVHIVTLAGMGAYTDSDTFFVNDGETIGFKKDDFKVNGYKFTQATVSISDETAINWNIETDKVTDSIVIVLNWEPEIYTVTFIGYDDEILDIQKIPYSQEATPPECGNVSGYVFCGFGAENYTITEDTTFTAKYVPENAYVGVTLAKTKVRLLNGTLYKLDAVLSNPELATCEVMWCSSNEDVATVDSEGNVTAKGTGTTMIYALYLDSESVAACEVTVVANVDEEITIVTGNGVGLDSSNQIRGISVDNTKVSDVRKLFENDNLVFVDINGYILEDTDLVGTGTKVRILDGTKVVDEKIIVVTGDMNGDGKINNRDASMIVRYLVDKEVASSAQLTAIDVNGDGSVNNRDAAMVSRYLVGKEVI